MIPGPSKYPRLSRTFCLLIALAASFTALFPLLKVGPFLDPDSGRIGAVLQSMVFGPDLGFRTVWAPGQPTWVLLTGFFAGFFRHLSPEQIQEIISQQSVLFALFTTVIVFFKFERLTKKTSVALLATLSLTLHPMFLWHSVVVVEEMFAFFFFCLAWKLAEYPWTRIHALVFFSVAVAAKLSVIGLFPLIFLEWWNPEWVRKPERGLGTAIQLVSATLLLVFLFFLPVFSVFGMDLAKWRAAINYFHVFFKTESISLRIAISWFLIRTTLTGWIVVGGALVFELIRDFLRQKRTMSHQRFQWVRPFDLVLLSFLFFLLFPYIFDARRFPIAMTIALLGYFFIRIRRRNDPLWTEGFTRSALWMASILGTIAFICLAPYSRSYVFFSLVPILGSLLLRFRNPGFWIAMAFVSFIPNLHYFQFSNRGILIRRDGYYRAFLDRKISQFNDGGFDTPQNSIVFYFPWVTDRESRP